MPAEDVRSAAVLITMTDVLRFSHNTGSPLPPEVEWQSQEQSSRVNLSILRTLQRESLVVSCAEDVVKNARKQLRLM